ncbi:MAG: XRE family transcriptional regulator [Verrucomicrobiae bacterium]|nr:XRE family transcriptional regulator [Verrucomicrobiae bacterium]
MNLIAEKRRASDMTQEEVAEATGIPLRTYVRIENATKHDKTGLDSVKAGNLKKLAMLFDCSLDELINPPSAPVKPGVKAEGTGTA